MFAFYILYGAKKIPRTLARCLQAENNSIILCLGVDRQYKMMYIISMIKKHHINATIENDITHLQNDVAEIQSDIDFLVGLQKKIEKTLDFEGDTTYIMCVDLKTTNLQLTTNKKGGHHVCTATNRS